MSFYLTKRVGGPDLSLKSFQNDLIVSPVPTKGWFTRQNWKLRSILSYMSLDGKSYEMPVDFVTDLASVPWLLYPILRPAGAFGIMYAPAAVLHDYLLRNKDTHNLSNNEIHLLFKEALISCGMGNTLAHIYYLAVRIVNP